jgi:hypothetical protein
MSQVVCWLPLRYLWLHHRVTRYLVVFEDPMQGTQVEDHLSLGGRTGFCPAQFFPRLIGETKTVRMEAARTVAAICSVFHTRATKPNLGPMPIVAILRLGVYAAPRPCYLLTGGSGLRWRAPYSCVTRRPASTTRTP